MSSAETDRRYMTGALALARRGLGNVWPNPAVGCVIVRDGRVVGRGWTQPGGRPHAETEALARAGAAAKGATAYVTLEPCSHHGQTGPCAEALVKAGIARVVVALADPDPRVAGQGLAMLRAVGIPVETGLLSNEARAINRGFFSRVEAGRPMVTLKLALSLDGKIAAHTGDSRWITGDAARGAAHGLRASHDAVAVGIGTAAFDDPMLDCRLPGVAVRQPVRIVFDSRLQLPLTARIIATAKQCPTWIVTLRDTAENLVEARADALRELGVELVEADAGATGRLSIGSALKALGERGLTRLLVEGGGRLAAGFLDENYVDALTIFRGPQIIGGDGVPGIAPLGLDKVADARRFRLIDRRAAGEDVVETYLPA